VYSVVQASPVCLESNLTGHLCKRHEIAASIAKEEDLVIYFPMDLSFVVKRLVKLINPSLFIAIETEIWPNLI